MPDVSLLTRKIANLFPPTFGEGPGEFLGRRIAKAMAASSSDDFKLPKQLALFLQELAKEIDAALIELDRIVGDVNLPTSGTTTTITDSRIRASSFIRLTPTNQNGAAALTSLYATYAEGVITLTFPASGLTRSYRYEITP